MIYHCVIFKIKTQFMKALNCHSTAFRVVLWRGQLAENILLLPITRTNIQYLFNMLLVIGHQTVLEMVQESVQGCPALKVVPSSLTGDTRTKIKEADTCHPD